MPVAWPHWSRLTARAHLASLFVQMQPFSGPFPISRHIPPRKRGSHAPFHRATCSSRRWRGLGVQGSWLPQSRCKKRAPSQRIKRPGSSKGSGLRLFSLSCGSTAIAPPSYAWQPLHCHFSRREGFTQSVILVRFWGIVPPPPPHTHNTVCLQESCDR